jgi:hypothetical protein
MRKIISIILILALASVAVIYLRQTETNGREHYTSKPRSSGQQAGTRYQPIEPALKPTFTELTRPWFQGKNSIWGATG